MYLLALPTSRPHSEEAQFWDGGTWVASVPLREGTYCPLPPFSFRPPSHIYSPLATLVANSNLLFFISQRLYSVAKVMSPLHFRCPTVTDLAKSAICWRAFSASFSFEVI